MPNFSDLLHTEINPPSAVWKRLESQLAQQKNTIAEQSLAAFKALGIQVITPQENVRQSLFAKIDALDNVSLKTDSALLLDLELTAKLNTSINSKTTNASFNIKRFAVYAAAAAAIGFGIFMLGNEFSNKPEIEIVKDQTTDKNRGVPEQQASVNTTNVNQKNQQAGQNSLADNGLEMTYEEDDAAEVVEQINHQEIIKKGSGNQQLFDIKTITINPLPLSHPQHNGVYVLASINNRKAIVVSKKILPLLESKKYLQNKNDVNYKQSLMLFNQWQQWNDDLTTATIDNNGINIADPMDLAIFLHKKDGTTRRNH